MNPSEVSVGLEVQPAVAEQPGRQLADPEEAVTAQAPAAAEAPAAVETLDPSAFNPLWLRLAYALEFLIALIAIITTWSEVGGEGHLDLMPWYTKLGCIVGLAWCSVRFTASLVEQQRVWTGRTVRWLTGILLFCLLMGGITYYYHLHEEPDSQDEDSTAAAAATNNHYLGTLFYHGNQRTFYGSPSRFVACPAVSRGNRIPAGADGTDSRLRL